MCPGIVAFQPQTQEPVKQCGSNRYLAHVINYTGLILING